MVYRNQINQPSPVLPAPNLPAPGQPVSNAPGFAEPVTVEQLGLITSLRQLWMQLALWSRSLIVSTAGNLGDVQQIIDRLMLIPENFSRVLSQYFEPQDADRFRELLEESIETETALIAAEKNNNEETVNQETRNWYGNANQIASYLTSINTYWDQEEWMELLNDYIEITLADLVARLEGDLEREVIIFDDLESQALKIADYMSLGIMEKFHP